MESPVKPSREKTNAYMRKYMRERYEADPKYKAQKLARDKATLARRSEDPEYREHRRAVSKLRRRSRMFYIRAQGLRGGVTAVDLARMWKRQRGLCALTGRRLTRDDAHIDHVLPKSRGGTNELSNMRWVCKDANFAKRGLTDSELFTLCEDVLKHRRPI